jgi:eukaryotic-like serine/threonine-protein kinase
VILFGGAGGLWRVSAAGGTAFPVTVLDRSRHEAEQGFPAFLPDGRHFMYTRQFSRVDETGVFVGSLDARPDEQPPTRLVATDFSATFAPAAGSDGGYILFLRGRTLIAQAFDPAQLRLTGVPRPIADSVGTIFANYGPGLFSVSANGNLVFRETSESPKSELTWFDRQGRVEGKVGEPASYNTVALSPDGTRVASDPVSAPAGSRDIWIYDLSRGSSTRLTSQAGTEWLPVWSPDSTQVTFFAGPANLGDLHRKAAAGLGNEEVLIQSDRPKWPQSWSPDGRFLLYSASTNTATPGLLQLWLLPLTPGPIHGKPVQLLSSNFQQSQGRFSPDGRFIAYTSNESLRFEVYVQPFSESTISEPPTARWVVSSGGGTQPVWRRNGREIFYVSLDSKMMAVGVELQPVFRAAAPHALFSAPIAGGGKLANVHRYDVTADGQQFLINVTANQGLTTFSPVVVVLNWPSRLK